MKRTALQALFVALPLLVGACGAPTTPEPAAAPAPAGPESPPPEAHSTSTTQSSSSSASAAGAEEEAAAPKPAPTAKRDPGTAAKLLEEGRAIVRERGEGGAADAVVVYERAIAADAQCAACYWELGWAHQLLSQWNENISAWDEVRKLQADFPELDTHYPVALLRKQQAEALANLPDASALPPVDLAPHQGPTLTLRAVGDVQLGMAWPEHRQNLPPNDARNMFDHVKDLLQGADVTFGNLETVLMDEGDSTKCGPKSTKCFAFRVPTKYAEALAEAGFDVLSIANNHTGDFGEAGRATTIEALDRVNILHSGPVGDIASWEVRGLKIGLVAFSTGGGVYRVQEIETAQRVVQDLARRHDIVIVSFHGGAEGSNAAHVPHGTEMFYGENRGDLRAFTHAVVDAGADLVLGHGPHLLRGMEIYQGRLIAYSLGNFCTWETFNLSGPLGVTGILEVELAANGVALSAQLHPGIIKKPGLPHPDPSRQAIKAVRKLSEADFGDALFDAKGTWRRRPPES